ncbi:PREDICTED: mannose-6-phosphate isomerase [Ceratosolen solmsi marchali]|uniref:Mannose-6-phosphate isomerase n=1 Tax=Ceratosolen solmsi marchali TaxID=326594 RepID=A0AAJ6YW47_9HYME|nr:PREDICTED: mannose-6-phosphate isomerase [Ceratosolen solmsi marchali]
MELKCSIQNYLWGKQGLNSIVAALMKSADPEFIPKKEVPYAELWMGTHPNGPSFLKHQNISLNEYIQSNSNILGNKVEEIYGKKLPFLFKVLSINKALSIQVHPNKEQAEKLHEAQPELYKDANHKPEMAIALTEFEALYGFRPMDEISFYIQKIPELRAAIGVDNIPRYNSSIEKEVQNVLKSCFTSLVTQSPQIIFEQLSKFRKRLSIMDEDRQSLHADLIERLHSDYPGDVGCFSIYFFNYIKLQPGEAIYIGANEPHTYLFGDCIECMACSDNVVRAGLTSKIKDIETLVSMLTYIGEPVADKKFKALREDECTQIFRPPIQDFAVAKITIAPEILSYNLIQRNSASILIIIDGKAEILHSQILHRVNPGSILFIEANKSVNIKMPSNSAPMLIFQAFVNI